MNRNADLLIGKLTLANDHKPIRRSALQSAGSRSQSALREVWMLPMNPRKHRTLNIEWEPWLPLTSAFGIRRSAFELWCFHSVQARGFRTG
jgi:hypothetical protein